MMMSPQNSIAVVYISDKNYHDLTQYSLASIARLHKVPLDFKFFQVDYSQEISPKLRKMAHARGHQIEVMPADFVTPADAIEYNKKDHGYYSYVTALKARAIDAVVKQYNRVLYIDGDVLAFEDIHLERLDGFDQLFAAIFDISKGEELKENLRTGSARLNGLSEDYFNAGVIMINSKKWIEQGVAKKFADVLKKHEEDYCPYFGECICSDQCVLNIIANGDWLRLPLFMNALQSMVYTKYWKNAYLRHYTGPRKFLSMRIQNCDPRAYKLVRTISVESGLPYYQKRQYDGGLIHWLNGIRRRANTDAMSKAAAEVERRMNGQHLAST
jgi:lipopolysaccharide biosynthesis glycosyltransferase